MIAYFSIFHHASSIPASPTTTGSCKLLIASNLPQRTDSPAAAGAGSLLPAAPAGGRGAAGMLTPVANSCRPPAAELAASAEQLQLPLQRRSAAAAAASSSRPSPPAAGHRSWPPAAIAAAVRCSSGGRGGPLPQRRRNRQGRSCRQLRLGVGGNIVEALLRSALC